MKIITSLLNIDCKVYQCLSRSTRKETGNVIWALVDVWVRLSAFNKLCRIDQLQAWSMNQTENVPFYAGIPFLVIGLIGNLLVIRIVHKIPEMHTPTNYLRMSIAVSDVVTILLWPLYYFQFAKVVCEFVALAEVSIMVSSNTLTVLAVERYHAILKPFKTGLRLNEDNIKRAIACICIASFVICFPEFF